MQHGRKADEMWKDKNEKHINIASVYVCLPVLVKPQEPV